jgi:chromosome segregation ATPase
MLIHKKRKTQMMKIRIVVGVCAFVLGACATQKGQGQVTEQQLARVPSEGMAEVAQARADLSKAQDAIGRRNLAIASAEREISVAKDDVRVADAELRRTETTMTKADFDRNAKGQRDSSQDASLFRAQKEAAEAHLKAANSAANLSKAQKQEAVATRDFAAAQVESCQYDALVKTGDPSVKDTNANAVKTNMDEARSRIQAAKGAVATAQSTSDRDAMEWDTSKSQFENRRGKGGAGNTK